MIENQTDTYKVISVNQESSFTEKKSRFLSFSLYVKSEAEVKDEIKKYKQKYFDARHICYAYVLGEHQDIQRSNDDGEPSGTAGKPILSEIIAKGLTNTLVLVVRYFGGILLGAANLGRAYKNAAKLCLLESNIKLCYIQIEKIVQSPYDLINVVERIVKNNHYTILKRQYMDKYVLFYISFRASYENKLDKSLSKYSTIEINNNDITCSL